MNGEHSEHNSYFAQILTNPPPLKSFDAFKKTHNTYREKTVRGGILTLVLGCVLALLLWSEIREYWWGDPDWTFSVDEGVGKELQVNFDVTVATPCHYLTVDVRDAVGDRLHISDEFTKDGTTFEIGRAQLVHDLASPEEISASRMLRDSHGKGNKFRKTKNFVEDGDSCRIYGSMDVKKVTGNLHITTLGHGYLSMEHTAHELMNLSHVIHEFSFGPYFPKISQPLDNTAELTESNFHIYQYFISIISTTYVDRSRRRMNTNQYSITEMSRDTEHGRGVPGIFFKYDLEPMKITITEQTTTLMQFIIRLTGIIGGILVCTNYAFRTLNFVEQYFKAKYSSAPIPTSMAPSTSSFGAIHPFGNGR